MIILHVEINEFMCAIEILRHFFGSQLYEQCSKMVAKLYAISSI